MDIPGQTTSGSRRFAGTLAAWIGVLCAAAVTTACGGRVTIPVEPEYTAWGVLVAEGGVNPFIAADGEGGAFIAFTGGRRDCEYRELWVQRVSPDGERYWGPDGVQVSPSCGPGGGRAVAVPDRMGGVFVLWQEVNAYWFVQRLDAEGGKHWPEPLAVNAAPTTAVRLAPGPPGELWIAWYEAEGADCGHCLQRLGPGGGAILDPPIVVGEDAVAATIKALMEVNGGAVVLVWIESDSIYPTDTSVRTYMNVFEPNGSARWSTGGPGVEIGHIPLIEDRSFRAELPTGEVCVGTFDVVFYPPYDSSGQIACADAAGKPLWPEPIRVPTGMVHADSVGDGWMSFTALTVEGMWAQGWEGREPAWTASIPDESVIGEIGITAAPTTTYVTWYSRGLTEPRTTAVRAAALDRNGTVVWGPLELDDFLPLSPNFGDLVWDGKDGALTAWDSFGGVWFQRLTPNGPALP